MVRLGIGFAVAVMCAAVAGCGGGGGGGGGPVVVPLGTFKAGTDRTTASSSFSANVTGANADGTTVQIYGDERTGPTNAYTSSHRLTMTLYGPVTVGSTFSVGTSHAAGTAVANYLETTNQNGSYVTTGIWSGSSGSITVSAADGSHIQGSFAFNTMNTSNAATIHWTAGQFNVAYETPPPPPQ